MSKYWHTDKRKNIKNKRQRRKERKTALPTTKKKILIRKTTITTKHTNKNTHTQKRGGKEITTTHKIKNKISAPIHKNVEDVMIVLSLGHASKSNKERDTIYMATRRMAGLDEKQTEWGAEVEVEVEGKVGGTEYWQCRLGLQWKRVSMLRRRRLTGARVARHLVPPTSEKQTKRERAKKKQEAHKIKPPFKREEEQ